MFAWGDGTILRLLRDPAAEWRNEMQAAAMRAAAASGLRVPAVVEVTTAMGRPGIVMERIPGADLLTLIGRRPWTVFRAGRISGEVQARLHEIEAPPSLPPVREVLRLVIERSDAIPADLSRFALGVLDTLPDGDRLCHGDFHPANIMMDGETPVVIDWSNVARGAPEADLARSRVILKLGKPPPGTSPVLLLMALVGRELLVRWYLNAYARVRPVDWSLVKRWEVPVAAARFGDGIAGEERDLQRFLERERRRMAVA